LLQIQPFLDFVDVAVYKTSYSVIRALFMHFGGREYIFNIKYIIYIKCSHC